MARVVSRPSILGMNRSTMAASKAADLTAATPAPPSPTATTISAERGLVPIAIAHGQDQLGQVLADCLRARPPEERLRLRVPIHDAAVRVHLDHRIERGVDDLARRLEKDLAGSSLKF